MHFDKEISILPTLGKCLCKLFIGYTNYWLTFSFLPGACSVWFVLERNIVITYLPLQYLLKLLKARYSCDLNAFCFIELINQHLIKEISLMYKYTSLIMENFDCDFNMYSCLFWLDINRIDYAVGYIIKMADKGCCIYCYA